MTDRDALLAAIRADPDDDTARLVYADWLQENGQSERGEFIRAQIEAVRSDPFGPQARRAAARAEELHRTFRHAWTRHLAMSFVEWPKFERGFIAHLSVEPVAFVPHAGTLFTTEPIQALKLFRFAGTEGRVSFREFFELPCLRQLRRLELSSRLFVPDEFGDLSACPHLVGLRDLSLRDNPVLPPWLSSLLQSDTYPHLAGLDLAELSNLGPCLAGVFPQLRHRDIRRLNLTHVVFNSEQMQAVLKSRCLRQVEDLRLGITPRDGLEGPLFHLDLSFVIPWDRLVVLDLSGHRLGNRGVRELTIRNEATSLRWLGLANNLLGSDAVRYLVEAKHLALNHLVVAGNNFSLSDIDSLQRRFPGAVIES
jgi:uncharacterized protein (TIGR02996 family)